ncbi:MAG: SxtJ family membrane protein [Thainema sp.]
MAFSSGSSPLIRLELSVEADDPSLLAGLDTLVQLSWISETELRQLAATQLSCPVPIAQAASVEDVDNVLVLSAAELEAATTVGGQFIVDEPDPQSARRFRRDRRRQKLIAGSTGSDAGAEQARSQIQPIQPPRWAQITQSLMAELSVVWLLCIGVVLVVLSSALLAASQWSQFSAAGQYAVLLAYTLVLGGSYYWTSRQASLQLTSRTLLFLTLLLVPVNFWAMDQLNLWQSVLGLGTIEIATVILSAVVIYLYRHKLQAPLACTIVVLGLCLLQWGWQVERIPLLAVYGGAIAGTLTLIRTVRQSPTSSTSLNREPPAPSPIAVSPLNRITLILLYALGLLVLRVLSTQAVEIQQISLALGIVGWGLGWLVHETQVLKVAVAEAGERGREGAGERGSGEERGQEDTISSAASLAPPSRSPSSIQLWGLISGIILLLSWGMAVEELPWQAVVISGFGLHLVVQSLRLTWARRDLIFLLLIGLQLPILIWQCVPDPVQISIRDTLVELTQVDYAFALLGVVYLPYVALIVGAGRWLKRRQHQHLVPVADWFAIGLGGLLTLISLLDPLTLAINLIVSTLLLGIITQRQTAAYQLGIYTTQIVGVLAIISLVNYLEPQLPEVEWIALYLSLAILEWIWSQGRNYLEWRRSSRGIGAALAIISYLLLWVRREILLLATDLAPQWQLLWLVIPFSLTTLAVRERPEYRHRWALASTLAVVLLPLLTFEFPETRSQSLLFATGLMIMNTVWLASRWAAGLTVGFGLAFGISVLWDQITARPIWVLLGAIAVGFFWLIWAAVQRWAIRWAERPVGLQLQVYGIAVDLWAIGLSGVLLLMGTADAAWLYLGERGDSLTYVAAFLILLVAIIGRTWRETWSVSPYVMSWAGELLLAGLVHIGGGDILDLAIANSVLGSVLFIVFSIVGQQGMRVQARSRFVPPLLFALIAIALRSEDFTAWTGWLTVVAAIIGVGVGRQLNYRWLKWVALIGLTLGWYELVFYQLSLAEGGSPADGMVILALVVVVIMGLYRLLKRGLARWLAMERVDIQLLAHLHWVVGILLMILSAGFVMESGIQLRGLAIAVGLALVVYALEQGRLVHRADYDINPANATVPLDELWVYAGLVALVGLGVDIRLMAPELRILQPWLGAIAGVLAILIYSGSWRRWGWSETPWRRFALLFPVGMVITTAEVIHSVSLAISAASYVLLARQAERIRLTYLSVALIDWLIWRQCDRAAIDDPLAYVLPVGLSLIYVAQIDPALQSPGRRIIRHLLRLAGIGIVFITAFFNEPWSGLPLGIASLLAVFAGLALRTRAWLYAGTLFLGLTVIDQLIVLNSIYPFVKWLIGIGVGSLLIWIAATFETRREQVASLVQDWGEELENWS